jgi:hypothetical protein
MAAGARCVFCSGALLSHFDFSIREYVINAIRKLACDLRGVIFSPIAGGSQIVVDPATVTLAISSKGRRPVLLISCLIAALNYRCYRRHG